MQELRAAASFHVRNSRDSSLGAVTTIYVVLLRCSCDFSLFSKMVFKWIHPMTVLLQTWRKQLARVDLKCDISPTGKEAACTVIKLAFQREHLVLLFCHFLIYPCTLFQIAWRATTFPIYILAISRSCIPFSMSTRDMNWCLTQPCTQVVQVFIPSRVSCHMADTGSSGMHSR